MFQATPTLLIGIGGTGLKVATFVKKGLMEANNNELPERMAILVVDTEEEIKFQAGGWGQERGRHHATGPVKIETGEYVPLTGNVKALGQTIRAEQREVRADPLARRGQPNRHISTWFQANYYLSTANIDDAVWNLSVGAGQFRQFGRLALFSKIGRLTEKLSSALRAIRQSGTTGLYVHIVGSLAGGTGAALIFDIPHLVKQLAPQIGFGPSPLVLGHFVLAEGFRGTPEVELHKAGVKRTFDARCYAALREVTRLQGTSVDKSGGYPLVYDPTRPAEMSAKLEGHPYSYVYLHDGIRDRNRLNERPVEDGLAPSIADAIVAYIDDLSGATIGSHSVNYSAYYPSHGVPPGQVTYGSLGTYTIELPIYHITEGWAHSLAKEVLDKLLNPLIPTDVDPKTHVPVAMKPNEPGGRNLEPKEEARRWFREETTSLIGQLAEWGQEARRTSELHRQVVDRILALDALGWQQKMAPADPVWQEYVTEAQIELEGSLKDDDSHKYYVNHNRPGDSSEQKAVHLQDEAERNLQAMVGEVEDVWKRSGGDYRRALVRLGNHNVRAFEDGLLKGLRERLNGTEVGEAVERKQGKLGFIRALLVEIESELATSYEVLGQADVKSRAKRRPVYDAIQLDRLELSNKMRQSGGILGRNYRNYRDKSDELAQFHKADIARKVVYDLLERIHRSVLQLLDEVKLWERLLATATSAQGGAYALVLDGQREVQVDRKRAKNAVRWVIDDKETNDTYVEEKRTKFTTGKLEEILNGIEWRVGRLDGGQELRIDFALNGQLWNRRAAAAGQRSVGQRNVALLLEKCRQAYEPAWTDMSVTAYLEQNYEADPDKLAQRVYASSGYLLSTVDEPPMRTTYMRVYKEGLTTKSLTFLDNLRGSLKVLFDETTTAENAARERGQAYETTGQPSRDPFKLTFLMFGDLLMPEQIPGFQGKQTQTNYREFSGGRDEQWRVLQVLPAETNALEIEIDLNSGDPYTRQRRRELSEDVVAVLEDMDRFRLAMRCFAYGETDYYWNIGNGTGLLLHRYTPPTDMSGLSYWRLTVEPVGDRRADGRLYDAGGLALPVHYQLSDMDSDPDLWQAFLQLVCVGSDQQTKAPIDWLRVEDTLRTAMGRHRDQWLKRGDMNWSVTSDQRSLPEGQNKAAQAIRLNALIKFLNQVLDSSSYNWAWKLGDKPKPPEELSKQAAKVKQIQHAVDLLTAIRRAAEDDRRNLETRLSQIGKWQGKPPDETLALGLEEAPIQPTVAEAALGVKALLLEDGRWICSNGHHNEANDQFCPQCREKRPEAPAPEPRPKRESQVSDAGLQARLAVLKQAFDLGLLSGAEYQAKVDEVQAAQLPSPTLQAKLDALERMREMGVLSEVEYQAKVAEVQATA